MTRTASAFICAHDRAGDEMLMHDDPLLPAYVQVRECPVCGATAEWDTEADAPA